MVNHLFAFVFLLKLKYRTFEKKQYLNKSLFLLLTQFEWMQRSVQCSITLLCIYLHNITTLVFDLLSSWNGKWRMRIRLWPCSPYIYVYIWIYKSITRFIITLELSLEPNLVCLKCWQPWKFACQHQQHALKYRMFI